MSSRPLGFTAEERAAQELTEENERAAQKNYMSLWLRGINQLSDPRQLDDLSATDSPVFRDGPDPADIKFQNVANTRRSDFVQRVEEAYHANRNSLSLPFLASLDTADLEFFADPEFQQGVAEPIVLAGLAYKEELQRQRDEQELADRIYEEDLRSREAAAAASLAPLPGGFSLFPEETEELEEFIAEKTDEDALDLARRVRAGEAVLDEEGVEGVVQNLIEFAEGAKPVLEPVLSGVGQLIQAGTALPRAATHLGPLGGIWGLIGQLQGNSFDGKAAVAQFLGPQHAERLLDYQVPGTVEDERALLSERRQDAQIRADLKRNLKAGALPGQLWAGLDPSAQQKWIDDYGSEELARLGFSIEMQDLLETPEMDQAVEDLIDSQFDQMELALDAVDEENFMTENTILGFLTAWNDVVDSFGASALESVLTLTDQDKRDLYSEAGVADFFTDVAVEVEKGGHTPAGVFGQEGTFGGLMLNIGAGIIFDPTNWFIGPGAKAGFGLASRGAVRLAMKGPAMRLFARGLARDLAERGPRAAQLLNNAHEVGTTGEILNAVGLGDPVLTDNLWLLTKNGHLGKMTNVERVYSLLDDVQLRQIDELDPKKVEQAERTLTNANSWDDVIPIEYDEVTGRISVMLEGDELAVLQAAENLGVKKAPLVLRRPPDLGNLPETLSPSLVEDIRANPDDYVFHGTRGKLLESIQDEGLTAGQLGSREAAEEFAKNRIPNADDPVVLIYRKDQLHPFQTRALERGAPHTPEFPEGAPALPPPVGSYKAADGFPIPAKRPRGPTLDEVGVQAPKKVDWQGDVASPTQLFTDEWMGVKADYPALMQALEKTLLLGGVVPGATQSWGAIALGQFVRKLTASRPGRAIDPYVRTTFNVNSIPGGPGGLRRGLELIDFLRKDEAWGRGWQRRLLENEKALGRARLQLGERSERLARLQDLDQRLANRQMHESPAAAREALVEEAADVGVDDVVISKMETMDEIRFQLRQEIRAEQQRVADAALEATGAKDWNELYQELFDDYNRNFIATNPQWADDVDPETGLVPWNRIHRGFDPEEAGFTVPSREPLRQQKTAKTVQDRFERMELQSEFSQKVDPQKTLERFSGHHGVVDEIQMPATPVELAAATELGGAKYTKWTQDLWKASVRHSASLIDQLWKANVLISPRTFMVMSVDELTSLMHAGGIDFVSRYLRARADKMWARLRGSVLSHKSGTKKVSDATRARMQAVDSVPDEVRSYANTLAEGVSRETIWLRPNELGYEEAAKIHGRNVVENPAMRAYFGGEDAFRQWWNSAEGQEWSLSQVVQYEIDGETHFRPIRNWREGFEMADNAWTVMERIALEEGLDDVAAFRQAFEDTAAKVTVERTGQAINLPPWVERYFGPLRGHPPVYPGGSQGWKIVGRAFQVGAANPAAFRQGLAAEMIRVAERARLKNLFESQGLQIVPDDELLDILRTQGIDTGTVNQFNSPVIDSYLAERGIITEGYIGRLAEFRARDFVNNMTYSFEQGSRFGRTGQAVFPFGRAWGEMFGRWGRLLGSRAIARPWLRRLGLEKAVQKGLAMLPFNPRTAGFLSRVAGKSMEITGGLVGESETDLDLSPMTFLPNITGGVSSLIPGFGIAPTATLDFFVDHLGPRPEEDPIAYQRMIDTISQLQPGMQLHGRGVDARFIGGGFTGVVLKSALEAARATLIRPTRFVSQFTGDVRAELVASRAVSAALSDPDVLNDILSAETTEDVAALFMGNLDHASKEAAKLNIMDAALGWIIPARGGLDSNLDEVYGVWVRAARETPELFPDVRLPDDDVLRGDPELLLRTGDDIRRRFFSLSGWQRDLLVAKNPTLAVNLISTWEWSGSAPEGLPGREEPYKTIGTATTDASLQAALARHENYVRHGWVVPRDPNTKPHEIVGTALDAQRSIAATLYEEIAGQTNEILWTQILTEEDRSRMDVLAKRPEFKGLGIQDGRQLWEGWATNRERIEEALFEQIGAEPGEVEEIDESVAEILRELKATEDAWSTTWRGDDIENFSQRRRGTPIFMTEKAQEIIQTLDLDVEDRMLGEDFIGTLIDYRSATRGAAWNESRLQYTGYIEERGAAHTAAMDTLTEMVNNTHLDETWREQVDDFMTWIDNQVELHEGNYPRSVQDEAVERFNLLRTSGRDAPVNWERLWKRAFQSRFGPMEWEPPTPPDVFDEAGDLNPNAWQPFVQRVIDGDTIAVSENRGPSLLDIDLLPKVDIGPEQGLARGHLVRLLGVYAEDYYNDSEAADEQTQRLEDALMDARRNGDRLYLVRDPEYAGSHTDPFGRELAWLYIGDDPYYFPDELSRGQ